MTPKKSEAYNPRRGVDELQRITGLGREAVKAAIRTGELPGYHVGRSYTVPEEAFIAFCKGEWVAKPHPIFAESIKPIRSPIVTRRTTDSPSNE
jgi:hypothetical protein